MLEHDIRLVKNSSSKSKRRLFPWLWRRLKDSLLEAKEDENAAAVDGALKAGPNSAPTAAGNPKTKKEKPPPQPNQDPDRAADANIPAPGLAAP